MGDPDLPTLEQAREFIAKHGNECPEYERVPEYGGPCWTCQGHIEQCPLGQAKMVVREDENGT